MFLSRGVLAPSNAAMVTKIRGVVEVLGAEIATPAQAREILGLPQRTGLNSLPGDSAMNTASRVPTAAIRVEAKAASPEALDAALRLTEFDLPRAAGRLRRDRGAQCRSESERCESGAGKHAACGVAPHARP